MPFLLYTPWRTVIVDVWLELDKAIQTSIKAQLRHQLGQMRKCTQNLIGCINNQATGNVYDTMFIYYCGPFPDAKEFDEWCLAHISRGLLSRWKWSRFLDRERRKSDHHDFVLTHGDLLPRNIMVQGGVITGIIDWERSGFFPRYAKYAIATQLCQGHEDWRMPVLQETLKPCSRKRLAFTRLVEDRGL
ncbi:hypothetical protein diail_5531 [Diaporthe ilicicola]|nr:hypothetical protein diail_5531 [Diaporthe ilicicola]